jgi:transcriptional regulator with XRE-family HTH domain
LQERIKMLRKHFGLTQQEFANRLRIKRGGVANYEIGRNEPADSVVALICEKFNVNEEWLRTGKGQMILETTRTKKIADFMADVMKDTEDSVRLTIVSALADLDVEDWEAISKIIKKHFGK